MASKISTFEQYILSVKKRDKNPANSAPPEKSADVNENVDENGKTPVEKYVSKLPQDKVITTMDMSPYFFPLLFASEKGPLGIWDKQVNIWQLIQ